MYTTALPVRAVPALTPYPRMCVTPPRRSATRGSDNSSKIELPLSIPVLTAGLRVVAVTNISMVVAVGSVIGIGGLGTWFTEGYQADKSDQIVAGIVAIFLLAIIIDILILAAGRPSLRGRGAVRCQGGRMNFLQQAWDHIITAENWSGKTGLGTRYPRTPAVHRCGRCGLGADRDPTGLVIGHTGRVARPWSSPAVNALRALPTLGVLLPGLLFWGFGLLPPTVALTLLGVPPLLAGTYAGIANVDPGGRRGPVDGHDRTPGADPRRVAQCPCR